MILSKEQVREVFINTPLQEDYNFLEEDLIKIANAFAEKALEVIREKAYK
jgi:hypothetical protein